MATPFLKRCSKCALEKPLTDFRADKQKKDGLYPSCRTCCRAIERARNGFRDHKSASASCTVCGVEKPPSEYYADKRPKCATGRSTQCKDCMNEQRAARRASRGDAFRAETRAYYYANRENCLKQTRRWQSLNKDRFRLSCRHNASKRRARERGGMTGTEFATWARRQKKKCYWCGCACPKDFHVDHYVSLSRGGKHEAANLVISCPTCNQRKHAKDPLDFAREVGRLL